jgi:hypothetical protein
VYLLHLDVLLLWWFFTLVEPTCLVVVVVPCGLVGDVDYGQGMKKLQYLK